MSEPEVDYGKRPVCAHCGEEIQPAHPTGSGFVWAHANGGITLCVAGGKFTGDRAELSVESQVKE